MSTVVYPVAPMPAEETVKPVSRLTLGSRLEDLTLLWRWVEARSAEHAIPPDTEFAIQLCLEEAVSNIIRHGYGGHPGHALTVETIPAETGNLVFRIEDQAAPFNPLDEPDEPPALKSIDDLPPGGQGIRLLRKFAGTITYERLAGGNRLTIGFRLPR
ncbi:MAG TPA: ATP-binding protein [Terracidiphilus sp.]|jgi:anti-sigma regulatory factor (Ser/Thr protein kinase)